MYCGITSSGDATIWVMANNASSLGNGQVASNVTIYGSPIHSHNLLYITYWGPDRVAKSVRAQASHVEGWEIESRSSQSNDLQCWHLSLGRLVLGITRIRRWNWLVRYQDNVTEWEIRSWCEELVPLVGKHNKVAINVHCHKLAPILISS